MESITNSIKGFVASSGNQTQSGSEPVSGQTGSGTTDQPYDAGNTTGKDGSAAAENQDGSAAYVGADAIDGADTTYSSSRATAQ
ncbi:hypothetical protein MMC17_003087 [Xylographa soralifera]|nr:hypothetical protein [Xylographa soralifera]